MIFFIVNIIINVIIYIYWTDASLGTPINIFVQRGHGKNTWELGNLGNSLSNSIVTV